ncbi:Acidic leucine-rich nuclear phosphoprotein 32-related protein [Holothuria leucospilota]|uniref:Acidic leucine-rich nuclear phosphoprotein 32-related protein n=1 Tax=Holothuria leucospilota TaxID=206669 RepID=A0A9Q0YGN0_HOLLE|nr:Acidic leucine-rich nuclear phosphoprotein 32-related protein [Holothuria leucospilota]
MTSISDTGSLNQTEVGSSTFIAVPAPTSGGIPVVTITTAPSTADKEKTKPLPPLPSHRYRYTLWHDLQSNDIKGDQLRHPRVRKGPPVKDKVFYDVKDEQGHSIHHNLKGTQRKEFQRKAENWECAQKVNLSYQDLGHDYQVDTFLSILKRLSAADEIQLMDNNIQDLRAFNFPKCISLNLSNNFVSSFNKLPKCPRLQTLNLCDNSINSFGGLSYLSKYPDLHTMDLRRNPICFEEAYRQRIFQTLPSLKVLDGIPKLPSDESDFTIQRKGYCVIS